MSTATAKAPAVATKQEIEQVKKEIRELLPSYNTRRLELGMKLIHLQELLAHHGKGTRLPLPTSVISPWP
jgi:hypothetical protein